MMTFPWTHWSPAAALAKLWLASALLAAWVAPDALSAQTAPPTDQLSPPSSAVESGTQRIGMGGIAVKSPGSGTVRIVQYVGERGADGVLVTIRDLGSVEGPDLMAAQGAAMNPADAPSITLPLSALTEVIGALRAHGDIPEERKQTEVEVGMREGSVIVGLRQELWWPIALALGLLGTLTSAVAVLYVQNRKVKRSRAILIEAQKAGVASREAERVRVSRELHDGPLQHLLAVGLTIKQIASEATGPASQQAESASERLRNLADELRAVAGGLRPPVLENFGLGAAIDDLARAACEHNPTITVISDVDDDDGNRMTQEAEIAVYRIAQEALANAIEHADPSIALVQLRRDSEVELVVYNDGAPFDWPTDLGELRRNGHFGLVGMAERAELLQAKLTVAEAEDGGVRMSLRFPFKLHKLQEDRADSPAPAHV